MPRFKEEAVCIRLIDWSETSQIVALLTEGRGKIRGLAKGSKRMSPSAIARYSGGIELLTGGQAVGLIRPNTELANITEWDLQQPYHHLRNDLEAQQLALYAADLVNAMLAEHDQHPTVFAQLTALLSSLAETEPAARARSLLQFQWWLMVDCGYRPRLDHDTHTDQPLPDEQAYLFDPRTGGLTQDRNTPANGAVGPWRVRRQTVELLRQVDGDDQCPATDAETAERANRLLCVYARAILDRQLPTMSIVLEKASS